LVPYSLERLASEKVRLGMTTKYSIDSTLTKVERQVLNAKKELKRRGVGVIRAGAVTKI
jgi:hypothetical protein